MYVTSTQGHVKSMARAHSTFSFSPPLSLLLLLPIHSTHTSWHLGTLLLFINGQLHKSSSNSRLLARPQRSAAIRTAPSFAPDAGSASSSQQPAAGSAVSYFIQRSQGVKAH